MSSNSDVLDNEICLFSQDGERLLTAFHAESTLYGAIPHARATLWSLPDLKPIASLAAVGDSVGTAVFDSQSRYVATAHDDRSVRWWDAHSGEQITSFHDHKSDIDAMAFSPEGCSFASASKKGVVFRNTFGSTADLILKVRAALRRTLTREQRKEFFLSGTAPE